MDDGQRQDCYDPSPLLHEWNCGEVTVGMDAALRIVVVTSSPQAVVRDPQEMVAALQVAEERKRDAEWIVATGLTS